ncbi:hypothetical protein jhhlp_004057 [Lomentospora prolificans]|uniref:Uncharacterized protein n=1 Tax=Lomentospora prolificans TaxID=41688 RepID=A0A2N3NAN3_9PEZI|nr:hypothetical protein jhhlp_004057 [Lomentospora prolificans]
MNLPVDSQLSERFLSLSWPQWLMAGAVIRDGQDLVHLATSLTAESFVQGAVAFVVKAIYNVFFHPLRHFPGPISHRASIFPWGVQLIRGTLPFHALELHQKYGPVVRIRPSELAFANAQAWQDIYGHKVAGKRAGLAPGVKEMPKVKMFYKAYKSQPETIITSDHDNHAKFRKVMAPSFSEKSMRAQEPLITKYVDLLISRLHEYHTRGPQNMTNWYNWTTFDVIGDLAFGDSFECLEKAESHPFIVSIFDSLQQSASLMFLRYLGLQPLATVLMFGFLRKGLMLRAFAQKTLKKRAESVESRPDLIEPFLAKKDGGNFSFGQLTGMASTLLFAGSETTASTLTGVTWLLLNNPAAYEKLKAEVRSTFKSEDEINFASVQNLSYMLACLNESLRLFPPVAIGLPRQVPEGGATIAGHYVPEGTVVDVYQWAINRLPSNWNAPTEFVPERFMGDERFQTDDQSCMRPFSVGPRDCIGKTLAYVEMRVILARVIWNFDMELAEREDWLSKQDNYLLWRRRPLRVNLKAVAR